VSISEELKKVYAGDTSVIYLDTLSFHHSKFVHDFYIVNDIKDRHFFGDERKTKFITFMPVPFTVKLPDSNTSGNQDLQIALSNVSREMVASLELAQETPSENIICKYRVYLENSVNKTPENNPVLSLNISQVSVDVKQITAVARRFDMLSMPFPNEIYTLEKFPALRRG